MIEDKLFTIKYSVDPDYVHDYTVDALELLNRLEDGQIKAIKAFKKVNL
tara:strand:- start:622 stop:768 length:147 start_codon:yes stop_codon:yes gene_type:complete